MREYARFTRRLHTLRASPARSRMERSEEHTSELQSRVDLVCRLLLEKKKKKKIQRNKKKIKQKRKQTRKVSTVRITTLCGGQSKIDETSELLLIKTLKQMIHTEYKKK